MRNPIDAFAQMEAGLETGLEVSNVTLGKSAPPASLPLATTRITADAAAATVVPVNLTDGDDTFAGARSSNISYIINGLGGNDHIIGGLGADDIYGSSGNDTLSGDLGPDHLFGGDGADVLYGGVVPNGFNGNRADADAAPNLLFGGAGADSLIGDLGADQLYGGDGDDYLVGGAGDDILDGGAGNDVIDVFGDGGGFDVIRGGDGDDVFFILPGQRATIDGGNDFDVVDYSLQFGQPPGVTVNLIDNSQNAGGAASQTYTGIEKFVLSDGGDTFIGAARGDIADGGAGDDVMYGGAGNDQLFGGNRSRHSHHVGDGGDDFLYGGDGDDTLNGGDANDTLDGGAGGDFLIGGAGADVIAGGDGSDTASYANAAAGVSIDLTKASSTWTGDAQGDTLTSIEGLQLTDFGDVFRGDAAANHVTSGAGDDELYGGGGGDTLAGDAGNDTIQGGEGKDFIVGDDFGNDAPAGDDYLQGNAGDDTMFGGGGTDKLVGGTGKDTISGDRGGDTLIGNEGADIFRYFSVEDSQDVTINGVRQQDQISDFVQGEDKIDLSPIDANAALSGNQAFTFLADPAHHTGDWTGLVWGVTDGRGITTIYASNDADADAEMSIYMSHGYTFTANDFIL